MKYNRNIEKLLKKAKIAQEELSTYSQEEIDNIVKIIAKTVYDNAELLAKIAIKETKMGIYEDKVTKNKLKSKIIWNNLKGKKTVGIIGYNQDKSITKIAKPVGVVLSITPVTNPIVTPMCNAMFAIKGGNSIIISPHKHAKISGYYTIRLIKKELKKRKIKYPDNMIQIMKDVSRENTSNLMKKVDLIIATGGMGLVKAAYSSGKPSYGVGPGNVQVIIDNNVDFLDTVKKIIKGRTFDNGIICSSEQTMIVPYNKYNEIIKLSTLSGAYYLNDTESIEKFRQTIFINGNINKNIVGKSAQEIAKISGVKIPDKAKVILIEATNLDINDDLRKEKMCPVLTLFKYNTFDEAIKIAKDNLDIIGKGHSASVYSNNKNNVIKTAISLNVSRLIVNESSITAGGSLTNGFSPTTTLGCGTWGNNIISENLTYKHLINISRIGYSIKNINIPSDKEIWNKL